MHAARMMRFATLGGLLAAGLVLTACGGSSTHSAAAATGGATTTTGGGRRGFGAGLVAFRTCMRSHGVTLPTRNRTGDGGPPSTTPGQTRPQGGGGFGFGGGDPSARFDTPPAGVDPTKYKAALDACRSKLPTGGGLRNNSAFQAYRSCLQDHGVTLPATGGFGSINRNDPKVQAAMKTCQPLLPAGGFRRTTTTTAAPSA